MVWLPLPAPWTAADFVARAAMAGVIVRPSQDFCAPGQPVPQGVRIGLNCRMPRDRLEAALRGLGQMAGAGPDHGPD